MKTYYSLVKYCPKSLGFRERIRLDFATEYLVEAEEEKRNLESVLKRIDGRYSIEIEKYTVGTDDWDYVI